MESIYCLSSIEMYAVLWQKNYEACRFYTVEGGGEVWLSKSKLGVCRLELAVRVHDEVVDMLHCLLACKITFANIRHAGNSNKYGNADCGVLYEYITLIN